MNIIFLVVFVSFIVYYKMKLNSISHEYSGKVVEVREATGMAIVEEKNRSMLLQEGIGTLEQEYSELRSTNEELNSRLAILKKKIHN